MNSENYCKRSFENLGVTAAEPALRETSISVEYFKRNFRANAIEEVGARVKDEMVEEWNRILCGDRWFTDRPTVVFVDEGPQQLRGVIGRLWSRTLLDRAGSGQRPS